MKMAKPAFVKFEVPRELSDKVYEAIEIAKNSGKLRKGVNETTKCIERGLAKLVVLAEDVTPEEVLMHLPVLCKEKKVSLAYVPSKLELGKAAGIDVGTSSIAIEEVGEAKTLLGTINKKLEGLASGKGAEKKEAKAEEKPEEEPKKEAPEEKEQKKEKPAKEEKPKKEEKSAEKKEPKKEKKEPKAEKKK